MKFFIHLCLWLLKQQTRKRKRKCILCHFWNTPFGVFFGALSQKLEVLLSIFCGTKITLEWITFLPRVPATKYTPSLVATAWYLRQRNYARPQGCKVGASIKKNGEQRELFVAPAWATNQSNSMRLWLRPWECKPRDLWALTPNLES